jgi:outer membrane protein assembly factor BamD
MRLPRLLIAFPIEAGHAVRQASEACGLHFTVAKRAYRSLEFAEIRRKNDDLGYHCEWRMPYLLAHEPRRLTASPRHPMLSPAMRNRLPGSDRLRRLVLALAVTALVVGACSGTKEEQYVERPVGELYNQALNLLQKGDDRKAGQAFEEVERQHPYSEWATRAQLMSAYAYYKANAYDEAIGAARRFIDLHPGHKDVAYAYYLIGVCYYEQISDVGRDQKMTQDALDAFEELIRRFPDSRYARDAQLKADLARDHLAGKEMAIGRYYLRRGNYLAAINRFRAVVDHYQTTTHVPEALLRLTEAYMALGVDDEARRTAAVLGYNFPSSSWYEDSYALVNGAGR